MSDLRQRTRENLSKPSRRSPSPSSSSDHENISDSEDELKQAKASTKSDAIGLSILDVLRVLGGLFLLSSALSWFVTNESILWGYRPNFTRPAVIHRWIRGPLHLPLPLLALHNGTTSTPPILLAINGQIFDVSASPHYYGPGGMYHFFAGRDATRAFVTGCWDREEDLVGSLEGVERMFLSVEYDSDNNPQRRADELRLAHQKVADTVKHWENFFRNHRKYFWVGRVIEEEDIEGEEEKEPRRRLCDKAEASRPRRAEN
ncbi:MAG: hypothetical protein M1827_001057 [Pycnora praestabilis]|nr:MAG: hypothetical protein M1827_001057 [Pycnora praestabilis]